MSTKSSKLGVCTGLFGVCGTARSLSLLAYDVWLDIVTSSSERPCCCQIDLVRNKHAQGRGQVG